MTTHVIINGSEKEMGKKRRCWVLLVLFLFFSLAIVHFYDFPKREKKKKRQENRGMHPHLWKSSHKSTLPSVSNNGSQSIFPKIAKPT